jgi:hypothetical protein
MLCRLTQKLKLKELLQALKNSLSQTIYSQDLGIDSLSF